MSSVLPTEGVIQLKESIIDPEDRIVSKPDIAANSIFPILARASLFELHANLLELLKKHLSALEGAKNIVVVGPGAEALPFSEHLEIVATLVNGGNLILLDYNREICDKLPAHLEKTRFASVSGYSVVGRKKRLNNTTTRP